MAEAAKIRDVVARHAYVFDNGLSSPDFFDVEKRMASEEFGLLIGRIARAHSVLEIGCFTGLNLLGLHKYRRCEKLVGVDFVAGAIHWLRNEARKLGADIVAHADEFPDYVDFVGGSDRIICFDVLEHQLNVGSFLQGVNNYLSDDRAQALFIVPKGREYYDCGHVAFFPDAECLRNVLDYVFEVEEIFELKTCRKLFASCRRRA